MFFKLRESKKDNSKSFSRSGKKQRYRQLKQQLISGVVALIGLFLIGTIWYHLVEKWTWLDAAYMTINILATVGNGEIHTLSQISRLFTLFLILFGVIAIGYIANRFTEALIQGYFQDGIRQRQESFLLQQLKLRRTKLVRFFTYTLV